MPMRLCGSLHFLDKNYNKSTTAQINKWMQEMISLYGTYIDYFVYNVMHAVYDTGIC